MRSRVAFFIFLCAYIELCKFAEGFPGHSFFKKKRLNESRGISNLFNRNIAKSGSGIDNALNSHGEQIYDSTASNSYKNSVSIGKEFNGGVELDEGSMMPDLLLKNNSIEEHSNSLTELKSTNDQDVSDRGTENYQIHSSMDGQNLLKGVSRILNDSILKEQKSGIFGVMPRNIVNFRRFTTTTEGVTTLRPWQVSCCPQELNRNYTEPVAARPWDYCSAQTCSPEVTYNTTRYNQTESSSAQSMANNTSTNQTQAGVSTPRLTTALNTNNTLPTNQTNKSESTTTPITTPKYFKAVDSNASEVTRPAHKNLHSTNHAKNRKHSRLPSTSHTKLNHITEAYRVEETTILGTTSKPDVYILPIMNIANETAVKLILQYPARVIPVKVETLVSGNFSTILPVSLEQTTSGKNRSISNMGKSNRKNIFEENFSISNYKNLFNPNDLHKSNSYDGKYKKDILSVQINPEKLFHNDEVKKRSVHIDFFSLGRNNKCSVKTTKQCKVKYQSAPFYNLTALLGACDIQRKSRKKFYLNCTDEMTTASSTSLTTSVQASGNLTTTTTSANATVAALNNTTPSANRTKSTLPPVFKLKIGLLDINTTRGTTERLVRGEEPSTSEMSTEAEDSLDSGGTTCAAAAPATACTVETTTQSEDAALTATEVCTNQTTVKYVFRSTCGSSSDDQSTETTSSSTSIDELNNPELVDSAIYRGKPVMLNPNLDHLNEIKRTIYTKRKLKAPNIFNKPNNKFAPLPKLNRRRIHKKVRLKNYNKGNTDGSYRPQNRKKRTSNFQYKLISPQNKTGRVYEIIPSNQDNSNSKFINTNETNMKEQLIRTRSIFGQLLPSMGKTIKPKEHDKKPWELPWTPKLDRFQLYTDDITQQPIDVRNAEFPLFHSLLPNAQTTPDSLRFHDDGAPCPTCGYKNNIQILNSQKFGPMQYDILETQDTNSEKQGKPLYEFSGSQQDKILQDEEDIRNQISRGQEFPSGNPPPDKKWRSDEMECDCCLTYTLNYPKHVSDDVYSVNKRATTIKSLRLIEKLNDKPRYYIEIPEALGDLIKKAASRNLSVQPKYCTPEPDIIFKKKGKITSKGLRSTTSNVMDKMVNNTNQEPVLIIIPHERGLEKRVSVPLDYLYKLLESNLRVSTTSLPKSSQWESDLLHDAPAQLQQEPLRAAPLARKASPFTRVPFLLIPAYLPLEKEELINDASYSGGNANGNFKRPRLILNPSDLSIVLGATNPLHKLQDGQEQLSNISQDKLKNGLNENIGQIKTETYRQFVDNLRTYPEQSNSLNKYAETFSGLMNDTLNLSPFIDFGRSPKCSDPVLPTGSPYLRNEDKNARHLS